MHILIVGNGGREHALLWKLRRDAPEASFTVTRPNPGMRGAHPLDLAPTDLQGIVEWCRANPVDLVVIGPEAPLAAGLADRLTDAGTRVFGPSAGATRIESSKAFAKALMERAGVPTAAWRTFTEAAPAHAHIEAEGAPIVVKASGLAAGKGAIVCETIREAHDAVDALLEAGAFGAAGEEIVIEEFMSGEELSIFGICDGERVIPLLPAQDHKRIGEGEVGPNTGGMGAYAPVSIATPDRIEEARERIFLPVLEALAAEGTPFRGLLYAGLILTDTGLRVVEFNARFGDPEAQVVLPLLDSSLLELLLAAAEGRVAGLVPRWRRGAAVTTVVASEGYPGSYPKGLPIDLSEIEEGDDLLLFHAGTAYSSGGELLTAGGRVLAVTGLGDDVVGAAERSREGAAAVRFAGAQFRSDIGWREVRRRR